MCLNTFKSIGRFISMYFHKVIVFYRSDYMIVVISTSTHPSIYHLISVFDISSCSSAETNKCCT